MGKTSSLAKITRPETRNILTRNRLFNLLETRDQPVVWIFGPAGSGKTTLVSSYLSARRLPCLWYQLDERDCDPAHFFHYMGLAARAAAAGRKMNPPVFLQEYLPGILSFSRLFFEHLFSRLLSRAQYWVVFDNYQNVPAESFLHDMFVQGLEEALPPRIRIMVLSRERPPPAFAPLRAKDKVGFVGWNELRLTPEESKGIVEIKAGGEIDDGALALLHKKTDGWAAGLTLLLEQACVAPGTVEIPAGDEVSYEAVFDYLATELFAKSPPDLQNFLVKTAFLPQVTVSAARKLTGIDHADRILSDMNRRNYFTERLAAAEPTFRYHPLFREFLLSRKLDLLSPEQTREVRQKAAGLLEEAGQSDEAAALLLEANDWPGLCSLILKNAPSMMTEGRTAALESWLQSLPPGVMECSSWLLFWRGTCRIPFDPVEGRHFLEKAFALFAREKEPIGEFLAWSGVIDSFEYQFSDFTPLDRWISMLDDIIARYSRFPTPEVEVRVVSKIYSALTFRQPDHPKIAEWESRLNHLLHLVVDSRQRIMIGSSLTLRAVWVGDLPRAKWLLELLRPVPSAGETPALTIIIWLGLEAIYRWISGDFQSSLDAVEKSLQTASERGVHLVDCTLLSQGVYGALSGGDLQTAAGYLDRIKKALNPGRLYEVSHFHFMTGWESCLRGDLPQSLEHARTALSISTMIGVPFPQALGHIGVAQVLISLGDCGQARTHVADARRIGEGMKSRFLEHITLLVEARLAMEQGDDPGCLDALRCAMTIGKSDGYVIHPWWMPRVMARLCARALDAGVEVDYATHLVRKHGLQPETFFPGMERWPWRLKLYSLGRFELLKDDKPLKISRKVQEKPLAILKAMIALTEAGCRPEDIADILWPDSDGDSAYQSLQVTLHRLRSLIGFPEAVQSRQGRLFMDTGCWWVDTWAFEEFLERAGAHWRAGRAQEAIDLTEKAIALYRGPFLGAEGEASWAIAARERLRNKYLQSVGRLGDYWSAAGHWENARECFQKGFDVDDLAEGFCQGLMTCCLHLDRRSEALSIYRRFEKRLERVLGVGPSKKSNTIRDLLLKKD
jgi:LuxR family transcriptional regulator, maltose regulon positive regulatory protein